MKYVKLQKFCQDHGYTVPAARAKIAEGVWLEGIHWVKAPDGAIMINDREVEKWVEGKFDPNQAHR